MDLNDAISDFDSAETTLLRLETVWEKLSELIPHGIAFETQSQAGVEYENLAVRKRLG